MVLCYVNSHYELVNSCDWHTMQFLSEIINIRVGVFNLQFSDGLTLSWHELNDIVLYLATLYFFVYFCVHFYFK